MKIGVITPYDSANYGAYLQAYATQQYLKKFGHEVFFIKWRGEKERKTIFFNKPQSFKGLLRYCIRYKHNKDNYSKMTRALEQFNIVPLDEIAAVDLDAVVLGSDEIWNVTVKSFQKDIFFGIDGKTNLAYAPSSGNSDIEDFERHQKLVEGINKVKIIGVRDENTASIVEQCFGVRPKIVCDPTLLLSIDHYETEETKLMNGKYILVYSYHVSNIYRDYLKKLSRETGYKLVSACMYQDWCDVNICCTPLEFISLIKNAESVFTTTFHGSIFTLLSHKKCAIEAKSKKLRDLIDWTGMKGATVCEGDSYEDFRRIITGQENYELVEHNIYVRREESSELYRAMLKEVENGICL